MKVKEFPSLSKENEDKLVVDLLNWSLGNGLTMYPPNFQPHSAIHAPVTLYPTPFPKQEYEKLVQVQKTFNELYLNVVKNKKWLLSILTDLAKFDSQFTGKLFETYLKAEKFGIVQPLSLGLFRNDYMFDSADGVTGSIKQIEFNTVSVSFGGLSPKVGALHDYLNKLGVYNDKTSKQYYSPGEIPISDSYKKLALGLYQGNYYYNNKVENTDTIILFVVQPNERNCFDQRALEYELISQYGIKSVRMTLQEINDNVTIDPSTKKLYTKSTNDEISVVYYRSAYAPSDYVDDSCWEARYQLETTQLIKCPTLLTQLSGAKKIQQILTNKKEIEQFLPTISSSQLDKLLETFVKIYPLDDSEEGLLAKKLIAENPENFVLKPQREGGGNNIYKENIPGFLETLPQEEWAGYILMEIITPPSFKNKIIREGKIYEEEIISELGIFGTILFNEETGDILENDNSGWLLRSKFSSSNEGGVAAGFGCVDSLYLYD